MITKYAAMIMDPALARYQFEKAVYLAQAGRPGPVWLDIPLSVQSARIDPAELRAFDPRELEALSERSVHPIRGRDVSVVIGVVRGKKYLGATGPGLRRFQDFAHGMSFPAKSSSPGLPGKIRCGTGAKVVARVRKNDEPEIAGTPRRREA